MSDEINDVLSAFDLQPVLVDIGASGGPPTLWDPIARRSIYVGFDPDRRDLSEVADGRYARSIIVNGAVTSAKKPTEVNLYLTRAPYCSSTLPPDTDALPASSLSEVLHRLELPVVDWLKTDSQGTDLRLFQSLPDETRRRVLAVDIEPGLIDAYRGEDLFADAHPELLREGFWLSSLEVRGAVRMKRTTLQTTADLRAGLTADCVQRSVPPSPGWCEARYLRTIDSLVDRRAPERDYALLWVFAMIEGQLGFALDIACAYEEHFPHDQVSLLLRDPPLGLIVEKDRAKQPALGLAPSLGFKRLVRRLVRG
jgi:hypothetical protein